MQTDQHFLTNQNKKNCGISRSPGVINYGNTVCFDTAPQLISILHLVHTSSFWVTFLRVGGEKERILTPFSPSPFLFSRHSAICWSKALYSACARSHVNTFGKRLILKQSNKQTNKTTPLKKCHFLWNLFSAVSRNKDDLIDWFTTKENNPSRMTLIQLVNFSTVQNVFCNETLWALTSFNIFFYFS